LTNPVKTVTADKIELTEAFSYLCGHCNTFEPLLNKWKKGLADDVQLVKLHVIFQPALQHYARILYTAEALGVAEQINAATFHAIHMKRERLRTEQKVLPMFTALGISAEQFKTTFHSSAVDNAVSKAGVRTRTMNIQSTPQMIVNGRYAVTVTRELGHDGMLKVVDFLVDEIRAERK